MKRRFGLFLLTVVVTMAMVMGTGCSRAKRGEDVDLEGPRGRDISGPADKGDGSAVRPRAIDPNAPEEIAKELVTIYFDYDKSNIRSDQAPGLEHNAEVLKMHNDLAISLIGHCDDRGTLEYNLALGQRRANSVRDFLISRGVEGKRIAVISKGEEEPVDMGHNEAAYAKNRRAEFKITR
ncbi:peptidoglycan-associated lipoprotein Pal [bacterium]|nr:peptidoglycan-associated lipoprotein Pal [bacterium]